MPSKSTCYRNSIAPITPRTRHPDKVLTDRLALRYLSYGPRSPHSPHSPMKKLRYGTPAVSPEKIFQMGDDGSAVKSAAFQQEVTADVHHVRIDQSIFSLSQIKALAACLVRVKLSAADVAKALTTTDSH
ncbi:hypothetical protein EVAR_69693_1 [Eumeta japonica]|uniref:Uncharacterized protein n=1 Tax=Eumeta variegata TaxID=151549 RepID=A0A4C2A0R2_EUMVA|nr:hypothetical protein EVAR_69693_1 [Eumeta japonica]